MQRAIALAVALTLLAGLVVIASPAEAAVSDVFDEPLRDRPRDDSIDGYAIFGGIVGVMAFMLGAAERARTHSRPLRGDPLEGSLRRLPSGPMDLGGCS